MPAKISVTFSGLTPREAVALIEANGGDRSTGVEISEPPTTISAASDPLRGFVRGASKNVAAFVEHVARRSIDGPGSYRQELIELVGFKTERQFAGLSGGTGKWWAHFFGDESNPFTGEWDQVSDDYLYSIDPDLAQKIVNLLDEGPNQKGS